MFKGLGGLGGSLHGRVHLDPEPRAKQSLSLALPCPPPHRRAKPT